MRRAGLTTTPDYVPPVLDRKSAAKSTMAPDDVPPARDEKLAAKPVAILGTVNPFNIDNQMSILKDG